MEAGTIARRRMRAQRLWGAPFVSAEDVVRALGAMQSQELPIAKWSVAQRAKGVTEADVDRALADGTILRTHVLRPTWHFVLPADIRWMLALTAPRVNAASASYYRQHEVDDRLFAKSLKVLSRALEGRSELTRKEIGLVLDRAGIRASGVRLGLLLMRAELNAAICSGAPRGKQQTYAWLEDRVPQARALDREEALAELTRRYFVARGPATVKDLAWWSGLTMSDGRRGLELIGSELDHSEVVGRTYWFAKNARSPARRSGAVDLVQGYDESIIAYGESRDVLWAGSPPPVPSGGRPAFIHAVLLEGLVVGYWKPLRDRSSVVIETSLSRPLDPDGAKALEVAAERYGRFVGAPGSLS